jgi:hypothetical protein
VPAVRGGWRKGMRHEDADFLPLTPAVLAARLKGEVYIGLYPLLDSDRRWWVASASPTPDGWTLSATSAAKRHCHHTRISGRYLASLAQVITFRDEPWFGDADVDGPFLGVDAGEPGAGRGCDCRAAAEDRDGCGLELGVPAGNLPARGQGHGVDPVAVLAAAVVAEDGGEDGSAGAGDAGQFGEPGHRVGEVVEHEGGLAAST